ncbi:YcgL domain-containing protein [Lysobacter silvisoli]|uniref:YcgL domain-containing protein DX914_15195 n=1 Tax=Lysobacter silvisoli TaxID=2293254 RepID=A0A371JXH7_9GAMM|nr:YcgL domain-containing protein [Lysobacter silvisoli]RDZ26350.1 YcgL domain-containing protein [Lysobacter silvisoli]
MQAYVYKSLRKDDTYVFLAARDEFALLPEPLRAQLGGLQFVLELALTPERQLARGDAAVVRENLSSRGFHIQFPPRIGEVRTDG